MSGTADLPTHVLGVPMCWSDVEVVLDDGHITGPRGNGGDKRAYVTATYYHAFDGAAPYWIVVLSGQLPDGRVTSIQASEATLAETAARLTYDIRWAHSAIGENDIRVGRERMANTILGWLTARYETHIDTAADYEGTPRWAAEVAKAEALMSAIQHIEQIDEDRE